MFDYRFIEMLYVVKIILRRHNEPIDDKIRKYLDNYVLKNPNFGSIYCIQKPEGFFIQVYSDFFSYYYDFYNSFFSTKKSKYHYPQY